MSALRRVASLLALVLLAACGSGAQNRPMVIHVFPVDGTKAVGPVQEVRFTYSEPITVLNPFDIRVLIDGLLVPTEHRILPDNPAALGIRPLGGSFPTDTLIHATVIQGAVINADQHYADRIWLTNFEVGAEVTVPVGSPGLVTLLDPEDYGFVSSRTTPGGRDPVGIVSTIVGTTRRIWVQLEDGAGGGAALAWYDPAVPGPMTVIPLTATGELLATAPAITAAHGAHKLYVAFRDDGTGRVRVSRIDTGTAVEELSIVLQSVVSDPATMPLGLAVNEPETRVLVSCADGATGTLALCSTAPFSERDADPGLPGVQGVTLTLGAGAVAAARNMALVAPAANDDVTRVDLATDEFSGDFPSGAPGGMSTDIKRAPGGEAIMQSLGMYPGTIGLIGRTELSTFFTVADLRSVSDLVGAISAGADDARSIAWYGGSSRFVLLLQSPGGAVMTQWRTEGATLLEQVDLEPGTSGVQAADLIIAAPDATVVGQTFGAFGE